MLIPYVCTSKPTETGNLDTNCWNNQMTAEVSRVDPKGPGVCTLLFITKALLDIHMVFHLRVLQETFFKPTSGTYGSTNNWQSLPPPPN